MDINDLRSITTVITMLTFVGIIWWAFARGNKRRFDEAMFWAEKAVRERSSYTTAWRVLAASYALCGRMQQAERAVVQLCDLDPELRLSNLRDVLPPIQPKEMTELLADGLRRAGLPE